MGAPSCSSAPTGAKSAASRCPTRPPTAASWCCPISSTRPIASSRSTSVAARQPVLVLISEDPRISHRANEAMRIALGIVAGETHLDVVLTCPAVHLLDEETDDLVDGDDIAKFRASLKKLGIPFLVEAGAAPADPSWNADGHPVRSITAEEIAALLPRAERFVIF